MHQPSSQTLAQVKPSVPSCLVPAEIFAQAEAVLARLPAAFSAYYLECRLGATASRVDFLICTLATNGGRTALLPVAEGQPWPKEPSWQAIERFVRLWQDAASPLYEQVPLVWLEFDGIDQALPPLLRPSFHFCLQPTFGPRLALGRAAHAPPPGLEQEVAGVGLACLQGETFSAQTRRKLADCFAELPPGCDLLHLSTMLGRQPAALKANVRLAAGVSNRCLLDYLARIGWSGPHGAVATLLATFRPTDAEVIVDFTVGEAIGSMVGFAFAQATNTVDLAADRTLSALLDRCVELNLCSPEKRAALVSWPGSVRVKFDQAAWPIRLRRWLDLKIVCTTEGALEAKGYLGFAPKFSLL